MLKSAPRPHTHVPNVISLGNDLREDSYECLVSGNLEHDAFGRILTFLESSGFEVHRSSFESHAQFGTFSALFLVRSKKSDADMFALVEKIMRLHLVSSIEFSPRSKHIFSHFRFPVELINGQRSVLISPAVLLSLERACRTSDGGAASTLFFDSGRTYGANLAGLCPKKTLFENESEFIESVLDITQATGWGICRRQILEGDKVGLLLSDPPASSESDFLVGTLVGIAEIALNRKLRLMSTQFDKSKNVLTVILAFI
jgi:hypothetical protein